VLNKLTYFLQREPVTPAKRNNLLLHSLRYTLNILAVTHPIVSKYTITVKIKNPLGYENTSHTNTAHLLASTKANVMETPTLSQPDQSDFKALQTQHTQSQLGAGPSCTSSPSHSSPELFPELSAQKQRASPVHFLQRITAGNLDNEHIHQPKTPSHRGNSVEPLSLI